MNNFREVNDNILRDWLSFREEMVLVHLLKKIENIIFILMRLLKTF